MNQPSPWKILEIEPTFDKQVLSDQYQKRLAVAKVHERQAIEDAYLEAVAACDDPQHPLRQMVSQATPATPPPAVKRRSIWRRMLNKWTFAGALLFLVVAGVGLSRWERLDYRVNRLLYRKDKIMDRMSKRGDRLKQLARAKLQSPSSPCDDPPFRYVENPHILLRNGVIQNCAEWVRQALKTGADASVELPGEPFLVSAVLRQNYDIVAQLLNGGANPNLSNDDGNTALHYAVRLQDDILIEALLAFEADRNLVNAKGERPADLYEATPAIQKVLARPQTKAEP